MKLHPTGRHKEMKIPELALVSITDLQMWSNKILSVEIEKGLRVVERFHPTKS